jgi:NACalpha-BTF3-like transcription factor
MEKLMAKSEQINAITPVAIKDPSSQNIIINTETIIVMTAAAIIVTPFL